MRVKTVLLFFCLSLLNFAQNNQKFSEANTLYNAGKYAEAIDVYESILKTGQHSAALYFNLGNANYKLNNIAPSVYYYEKALLLNPNDSDIQNNLGYAQNMTVDAIDVVPKVGFSKIINNCINAFQADIWAIMAIVGIFIFVLLFLMYHFSYVTSRKRIAFIFSILGLCWGGFSLAMAFQKQHLDKKQNPAVVFAQESSVKSEANRSSEVLFRLHEGTKVQVLEDYDDWYKIQLSDNSMGWIPSEDVKLINSF